MCWLFPFKSKVCECLDLFCIDQLGCPSANEMYSFLAKVRNIGSPVVYLHDQAQTQLHLHQRNQNLQLRCREYLQRPSRTSNHGLGFFLLVTLSGFFGGQESVARGHRENASSSTKKPVVSSLRKNKSQRRGKEEIMEQNQRTIR